MELGDLVKIALEIEQEKSSTVILISNGGVIYCVDLLSGTIKCHHETMEKPYMACHGYKVVEYLDIGAEDDYPHYVSSFGSTVIRGKTAKDMAERIKSLCKQDPRVEDFEDAPYYLNCSSGIRGMEDGQDMLLIKRTTWNFSIDNHWYLSYSNFEVSEQGSKCLVLYARTPEKFIEICYKFGLFGVPEGCILTRAYNQCKNIRVEYPERAFVKNKGNISYLHGTFRDDQVFVKRVPKGKALEVIQVYKKVSHSDYVSKLLFDESDYHYHYLAFEKFQEENEGTLADFIKNSRGNPSDHTIVLRYVVRALMDLHARGVLHCNITPEHVLVRTSRYSDCDYVVKLCGLGNSRPWKPEDIENKSHSYMLERQNLARLILNFMTRGSHKCATNETPTDYNYIPLKRNAYEDDMKVAGDTAADLVQKLMDPDNPISFSMVYKHILFWSFYEPILFLRDASDEIYAKSLKGIQELAPKVFKDDWGSIIEKTEAGKAWFKRMQEVLEETEEEVPEEEAETKETKEVHEKHPGAGGRGEWRGGARHRRVHRGRAGNMAGGNKAEHEHDKAEHEHVKAGNMAKPVKVKRPVYNTKKLKDLLRLIRNGVNHPCGLYPGVNKITMWEFVSANFPSLLVVVYNHVMSVGKGTRVYIEYCMREK